MCIATLAASAVYGPARGRDDCRNRLSLVCSGQAAAGIGQELKQQRAMDTWSWMGNGGTHTASPTSWLEARYLMGSPSTIYAEPVIASILSTWSPSPSQKTRDVATDSEITTEEVMGGLPSWQTLLSQWGDWSVETMLRIMACESHGDPNAMSPDGRNWGAYQINIVHGFSVAQMTDPVTSTAIAHDIWLSQGYRAWSCY